MLLIIVLAFVALIFVTYIFVYSPRMKAETEEGFIVPYGAGVPACARSLPELSSVMEAVIHIDSDDARELALLSGKLACAKTDLLSTAGVIQASAAQPFSTAHDLQPIQETLNQCFNKNISERDLDIIFDQYRRRGDELLASVCDRDKSVDLPELAAKFKKAWTDVYNIAKQMCLVGPDSPTGAGKTKMLPGMPGPDMAAYVLGGAGL
jgi:hypothetical protein